MSMTGLPVFDETVHLTNGWLHEIAARMGWEDRRKAYRLLRASLHALRDRLPATEAAQLAAQLPMLMRGIFYEGWRPTRVPVRIRDREAFLAPLAAAFSEDAGFDPEAGFREVLEVMKRHVSAGEMTDLRRAMPEALKPLWTTDYG